MPAVPAATLPIASAAAIAPLPHLQLGRFAAMARCSDRGVSRAAGSAACRSSRRGTPAAASAMCPPTGCCAVCAAVKDAVGCAEPTAPERRCSAHVRSFAPRNGNRGRCQRRRRHARARRHFPQHSRRRRGGRVAPVQDNRGGLLQALLQAGVAACSPGDVPGQALGFIPVVLGNSCPGAKLVEVKAADHRERWLLLGPASPTRVSVHRTPNTLASTTSDNVKAAKWPLAPGIICPNGPHSRNS